MRHESLLKETQWKSEIVEAQSQIERLQTENERLEKELRKLKQGLHNAIMINADDRTRDMSFLQKSVQIVLFNTSYLSHTLYYCAMKEVEKSKSRIVYVNESLNMKETIQKMFEAVAIEEVR